MKLTEKASGPFGAPAAASQQRGTSARFIEAYRAVRTYWHNEFVNIPTHRILLAAATATTFMVGASCIAIQNIHHTQTWNRIYTNGSFVGLVPNTNQLHFRMEAMAKGYHLDLSAVPIHTSIDPEYHWQRVASLPTNAYAIQLNHRSLVFLKSESEARNVLRTIRHVLTPAGMNSGNVRFSGHVAINPVLVGIAGITSTHTATYEILHPGPTQLSGRSGAVDVFSGTALHHRAHGTHSNQNVRPLIQVIAEKTVTRQTKIAFPIHYVSDANLAQGTVNVKQPGVAGIATERLRYHYVNGHLQSSVAIAKQVLQAPQPEIDVRGTNSGLADGSWSWPSPMFDITSGFGWRTIGSWRNFHPGVDIGCPVGTPVLASNNGVVEDAGWNSGGYGNWVRMNNGNSIETVYGHMSRVLVHPGEVVTKGELIGESGATGNVTGPHLHYEVRVNGTPVPPGNYM